MFLGEYQHSLDAKGRVILPARFRDQLEGGAVMARALDGCLAVYPVDEFDRLATRIREVRERGGDQRQTARTFFAGAIEIAPDKQGRVAVPQHLRDYAGLEREVIVPAASATSRSGTRNGSASATEKALQHSKAEKGWPTSCSGELHDDIEPAEHF